MDADFQHHSPQTLDCFRYQAPNSNRARQLPRKSFAGNGESVPEHPANNPAARDPLRIAPSIVAGHPVLVQSPTRQTTRGCD